MNGKTPKAAAAVLLAAAQLLTLASCSNGGAPSSLPMESAEPSISQTQESSTPPIIPIEEKAEVKADSKEWKNSNYKKAWYSFDENAYNELLKTLTVVSSIGTEGKPEHRILYMDGNRKEGYIFGDTFVKKEDVKGWSNRMMEKTGRKLYTVKTKEEKEALLKSQFDDTDYLNGNAVIGGLSKEIDGDLFIDMTKVSDISWMGCSEVDGIYSGKFHDILNCGTEFKEKYTADKSELVTDADLNKYKSPVKLGTNTHMYATVDFVKNVIGIDVQINGDGLATIWFDDIYKPTEDSIIVIDDLDDPTVIPTRGKNISKDPNRVITSLDIINMTEEEATKLIKEGTISMLDLNIEEITEDIKQRKDKAYIENSKKPYRPYTELSEAEVEEYIKNAMYVKKITREEAYEMLKMSCPVPTIGVRHKSADGSDVIDGTLSGIKGDIFN